jgi:hypothetical protein
MAVTLIRADDRELNMRAVERAAARLIEAVRDPAAGCRWCCARDLAWEFAEYLKARRPAEDIVEDIEARVARVLATEPPTAPTCRHCRRARRIARYEGTGCALHAQCSACRGGAVH